MEIERRFLLKAVPKNLKTHPKIRISQTYISVSPVIRLRKADGRYILTVKSKGALSREEFELPLEKTEYAALKKLRQTRVLKKTRFLVPCGAYTACVDIFGGRLKPLKLCEVEFASVSEAKSFAPPAWFGPEVTYDKRYTNSFLASRPSAR